MINEEQVAVVVSPHHFKAIVQQATALLKNFEELNGPLDMKGIVGLAPEVIDKLKALAEGAQAEFLKMLQGAKASGAPSTEQTPHGKRSPAALKKKTP
jgi:hypothetical protein